MPSLSEKSPLDPTNFSFSLMLQARFAFVDTSRGDAFNLETDTARFGFKYKYGTLLATLEAQAGTPVGDTTQQVGSSTTPPDSNGDIPSLTPNNPNTFSVRKANINVNFVDLDFIKVGILVGRDRLNTSIMYSPDGMTLLGTNVQNASSYGNNDGLGLKYAGNSQYGIFTAGIGYYNNAIIAIQNMNPNSLPFTITTLGVADNNFGFPSTTQSRAMALHGGADLTSLVDNSVIEIRALYQLQKKLVTNIDPTKTMDAGKYTARDASSVEASVGFNYARDLFRVGLWGQWVSLGHTLISQGGTSNQVYYEYTGDNDANTIPSENILTLGLGFTGNTKPIFSNFFGLDDSLTYGAALQYVTGQRYNSSFNAGFKNEITTLIQYNFGVGYQESLYKLELDYLITTANNRIYTDINGQQNISSQSLLYLVGTLSL